VTINESSVYLPEVIRNLETIIRSSAEAKQQVLTVEMRDIDNEYIITDKLRLNQVLLNILTNAVKFTPPGGRISFVTSEKPSGEAGMTRVGFRVRDNGIGMSEEFQKTIFEAFTREKSTTVSGIQGTGLGMAITKNIVDMMGGTIEVKSTEGKGSEFTVCIPCRISAAPEKRSSIKEDEYDFSGRRALIAEDNDINQQIAEAILSRAGFTVDIAKDGTEAVRMVSEAEAGSYDIVLMDIQMPIMDGYEATRLIRSMSDPEKANIPIIAVTANAFEEDRDAAFKAGMNGHLAKPYDIPKMMETLARVIK
jgi:CheY-like chemotaxis protein